jgi:eukaryotic-like serine/threonine-protein kinase
VTAPARIGRYRVERRLGSGAFATVWLATDEVLQAPVAVKVLADNWAYELDVQRRFLEEARILRRADSDRVVRVHDIGELDDGRPYFVMTYADRGTLADRIAAGPMPVAEALRYGREIARGVAVLHRVGVIHRDLTPGNVLLHGEDDRVLIADLGLAKEAARASGFTMSVGTAGYMAPEQARPGFGLDLRADVYSVAAIVHAMLTGEAPDPDEPMGAVPAPLVPVLTRALATRPEDRYDAVTDLAAELRSAGAELAAGDPAGPDRIMRMPDEDGPGIAERLVPVPSGRRPARPPARRRRRWPLVLGIVVLLALAAGGVVAYRIVLDRDTVVAGAGGALAVTVPHRWAAQYQDSGWDLGPYGQAGRHGVALLVTSDVAGWGAAGSNTPGVFVGRAAGVRAEQVLPHSAAGACPAMTPRTWNHGGLSGQVIDHQPCQGRHFVEATLSPAGGAYLVYVQVKEPDGGTDAAAVLDSISVAAP